MSEPASPPPFRHGPAVYFNGFELGLSNTDVVAYLSLSNSPAATVYMSYTTAKSFAKALADVISRLESCTERPIMTSDEVAAGMDRLAASPPEHADGQ